MLVLARRTGESIVIGNDIEVLVIEVKGEHVKLGISAPKSVPVNRKEVYLAVQQENQAAAAASPEQLARIKETLKHHR
jgi:carbon storage regulator